jgi:hypothetical protein
MIGKTKRQAVRVGSRKKLPQQNVSNKASKRTLFREITKRIRCPEGSRKCKKNVKPEWHLSWQSFGPKSTPWDFELNKKNKQKKVRDAFSWRRGGVWI